jgi:hypothetical protein
VQFQSVKPAANATAALFLHSTSCPSALHLAQTPNTAAGNSRFPLQQSTVCTSLPQSHSALNLRPWRPNTHFGTVAIPAKSQQDALIDHLSKPPALNNLPPPTRHSLVHQ